MWQVLAGFGSQKGRDCTGNRQQGNGSCRIQTRQNVGSPEFLQIMLGSPSEPCQGRRNGRSSASTNINRLRRNGRVAVGSRRALGSGDAVPLTDELGAVNSLYRRC